MLVAELSSSLLAEGAVNTRAVPSSTEGKHVMGNRSSPVLTADPPNGDENTEIDDDLDEEDAREDSED